MRARLLVAVVLTAGVVVASASGSSTSARWFFTPGKNIDCELGFHRSGLHPPTYVSCLAFKRGAAPRTAIEAQMGPSAKLSVCLGIRCIGDPPVNTPTLTAGHSLRLGPFRCTSLRRGVRCIVVASGHGFRLTLHGVKRI